jgi:glycosyltransferase involved in cell wall biosynthesis
MKILQISDYHVYGGDGHPLNSLCERLYRRGNEVEVYTSNLQVLPLRADDSSAPMEITRFRGFSICGKAVFPGLLWKLLTMKNPDVVHAWVVGFFSAFSAACLKPLKRYPLVITLDFDPAEPIASPLKKPYILLYRTLPARIADVLTAFTEEERKEFSKRFGVPLEKIERVPIGIDLETFSAPSKRDRRRELGLEEKFILLNVSFLSRKKNLEMVLHSLPRLPEEVVFLHVGETVDPRYRTELDRTASNLGVEERVFFIEGVSFEDLPDYYNAADLFIQPGFRESYAIPVLEAMASELPVLATPAGISREAVKEGVNGFLIRSEKELEEKVLLLSKNPKRRREMGKAARITAEGYSWEEIVDCLEEIYRRTAGDTKTGAVTIFPPTEKIP